MLRSRAQEVSLSGRYRYWSQVHAAVIVVLVVIAEFEPLRTGAIAALAVWLALSMIRLRRLNGNSRVPEIGSPSANRLTTVRGIAAVVLTAAVAGLAASSFPAAISSPDDGVGLFRDPRWGWVLAGALLVVESTDFLDGRLARRGVPGWFGGVWDMENDAVFAVALAVTIRHLFSAALPVLGIGLMRYLYVLLWRRERRPAQPPRVQQFFSKTVAATLAVTLILVIAPPVTSELRDAVIATALGLQLVSFGWDILLQYRFGRETTR